MSPTIKYTLARIGLFLVMFLALWPVNISVFLKLILAVLFSAVMAFLLLRDWRDEMAQQLAGAVQRRRAEKARLRAALAGEDEVAGGDEVASGGRTTGGAGRATGGDR